MKKPVIALGTTSTHKTRAAKAASDRVGGYGGVFPVSTESGVPEQPIGLEETRIGAFNRAQGALSRVPEADYGLGIESGLVDIGGDNYLDIAITALVDRRGKTTYSSSSGLQFPSSAVHKSIASGQTRTAGRFIAEAGPRVDHTGSSIDHTDPHAYLSGGRVKRNEPGLFTKLRMGPSGPPGAGLAPRQGGR